MESTNHDRVRFDARLPREQKEYFERAAMLGGYRNLTDFIIITVQNKSREIIEERERVIVSTKDKEIFFNSLINPPEPNKDLISARNEFNKRLSE